MARSVALLALQLLLLLAFSDGRLRKGCDCSNEEWGPGHGWRGHGRSHDRDHGPPRERHGDHRHIAQAACNIQPNTHLGHHNRSSVTGNIYLRRERGNGTEFLLDLHGFPAGDKKQWIQVHEFGDLTQGCDSLGSHFNPQHTKHGRHTGDLGNLRPDPSGNVQQTLTLPHLHLRGEHSVVGRSIVIHETEDNQGLREEHGSSVHGNAGHRIACCVIGVSDGRAWSASNRQK
ncbi:uncharacterized protein [Narcine bancroftii]|uniref:uncharacterized protein isoform X2 n=1 Tax=Narcine bancroftii TaxID=1343680 RepID=UPI00383175D7